MKKNDEIVLGSYTDLAIDIVEKTEGFDKHDLVSVVCFYEEASMLFKELCCVEGTHIGFAEINPADFNGYSLEYLITVDDDLEVSVEPLYSETSNGKCGRYKDFYASYLYIDEKANIKDIEEHGEVRDTFIIEFSHDEKSDDDSDKPDEENKSNDDFSNALVDLLCAILEC